MPTEQELTAQIEALEQEITKYKFKFNSKNADYVLLHQQFEEYKKQKHFWPWTLVLILSVITAYLYLNHD